MEQVAPSPSLEIPKTRLDITQINLVDFALTLHGKGAQTRDLPRSLLTQVTI